MVEAVERHDVGEDGLAFGERAGLVDDDGIDGRQPLQRLGVFDEDALACAATGRDHDRDGRGEPQGARAGNDENGHGCHNGIGERWAGTKCQPGEKCKNGNGDDGRHEIGRHPVGQRLDGRAAALRLRHQRDDARQHGLGADLAGLHDETAGLVERAAGDIGARRFLDRQRLAGDQRFIDRRAALHDGAVDGNCLTRAHAQPVADMDVIEGNFGFRAIGRHAARGLRGEIEQGADGVAGPFAGLQFEHLANKDQNDDDGGGLEVSADRPAVHLEVGREQSGREHRDEAVGVGDQHADGDQRPHVGAAVHDRGPAALQERPAAPQHHGRREDQLDPAGRLRRKPAVQRQAKIRPHGDDQDRDGESSADPQAMREIDEFRIRARVGRRYALGLERHAALRTIARPHLHDLGMHGAGVERILRPGFGFSLRSASLCSGVEVALRMRDELLATARAAEIVRAGAVPMRVLGALDLHRHAAHGVDRRAGAGFPPRMGMLVVLMLHRHQTLLYPGGV